jgi:hypothetical protein
MQIVNALFSEQSPKLMLGKAFLPTEWNFPNIYNYVDLTSRTSQFHVKHATCETPGQ